MQPIQQSQEIKLTKNQIKLIVTNAKQMYLNTTKDRKEKYEQRKSKKSKQNRRQKTNCNQRIIMESKDTKATHL